MEAIEARQRIPVQVIANGSFHDFLPGRSGVAGKKRAEQFAVKVERGADYGRMVASPSPRRLGSSTRSVSGARRRRASDSRSASSITAVSVLPLRSAGTGHVRGGGQNRPVHLSAIKLRGFKSFPDPAEIRFQPGVAVVVGPNGSGKSNIADAIVWAAGSLAPSELRAERADDVLFSGSADRPRADWCEVELLFDNTGGAFEEVPFGEVSILRRLHRGGEGEYLLNRTPVRRLDLVELLSDVGLGSGMHAIVGQGRVEELLASRPEERRALLEEAAGLGRFKQRRHRAELKLARVVVDVERAVDLEREVRARLRPLALQATAAERAEKLAGQISSLRATRAARELAELEERAGEAEERRTAAALKRGLAERELEQVLGERNRAEEELADAAGRREAATAALYRLRSTVERLGLRRERAEELVLSYRADLGSAARQAGESRPSLEALERDAADAVSAARDSALEGNALRQNARLARERVAGLERALVEREGLPPAARVLAEAGERLAVTGLRVDPGYERAVTAAVAGRGSSLLAADKGAALALAERARESGLGTVAILLPRPPSAGHAALPPGADRLLDHVSAEPGSEQALGHLADVCVVELGRLLETASGMAVTREGHLYAPERGELWYAGETAEAVLLELEAERRRLAAEADELERAAAAMEAASSGAARRAREAEAALARSRPKRRISATPAALERLVHAAERLAASLAAGERDAARFEAPLRARVDAGSLRAGALSGRLREVATTEAELRRRLAESGEAVARAEASLAGLGAESTAVRRRLEEIQEPPDQSDGRSASELEDSLARLERRYEALGQVNPLAKEEYEREQERLEKLSAQRADLERSLQEIERLRAELTETVERRFTETFERVRENFVEVCSSLFPGGEGRLRLTHPAEEKGGAEAAGAGGIEVELRPAGKRVTRLSLLSGGEKALGALAFLFSLFLARPSAFYLLDEVEAALDDPNIARFVDLLRQYSERAQFIVVTHQKRTMEAADVLYGVTMGTDGTSQIVSRRMAESAPALAALTPA